MGIIPPVDEADQTSHARSPYSMDIVNFVTMFALTPQRIRILKGFVDFRVALSNVDITDGFQWVDGSFTENIEMIEGRPPNDVDVVTFFNLQPDDDDHTVISRNPNLFDHDTVKSSYLVDSYFESLQVGGEYLVARTVYWYSMWAHKRDLSWKGFLQIPLSPHLDHVALAILSAALTEEVNNES